MGRWQHIEDTTTARWPQGENGGELCCNEYRQNDGGEMSMTDGEVIAAERDGRKREGCPVEEAEEW
ncbi:hypothetical protein A2U01_0073563 [Trifolium medium]|uniref:Uncharacterized protein n=1 Tax=Trifolium medium TaxID=97028 RepID=A0A392SUI6_9FABA|nr:hypothetical protein [Trifolium medium]